MFTLRRMAAHLFRKREQAVSPIVVKQNIAQVKVTGEVFPYDDGTYVYVSHLTPYMNPYITPLVYELWTKKRRHEGVDVKVNGVYIGPGMILDLRKEGEDIILASDIPSKIVYFTRQAS